jgi:hypothetical protein
MDKQIWNSACQKLLSLRSKYGFGIGNQGSQLNADGTPYEIAFAFAGGKQLSKIILDPYPELKSLEQRILVQDYLSNLLLYKNNRISHFLRIVNAIGDCGAENPFRFWISKNLQDEEIEIYSALCGDHGEQYGQLSSIFEEFNCENPFKRNGLKLGPISISSEKNIFTIYFRPQTISQIRNCLPSNINLYLEEFAGKSISKNGMLISYKYQSNKLISKKLDICAHCVSNDDNEAKQIAASLGKKIIGKEIRLPQNSKVAFWGVSWKNNWDSNLKLYIYLIPSF